jgi:hypothetical protein
MAALRDRLEAGLLAACAGLYVLCHATPALN